MQKLTGSITEFPVVIETFLHKNFSTNMIHEIMVQVNEADWRFKAYVSK